MLDILFLVKAVSPLVSSGVASSWLKDLQKYWKALRRTRHAEFVQIENTFGPLKRLARLYIQPDCQQYNPAEANDVELRAAVREPIFSWLGKFLKAEPLFREGRNTLFVLSDAGMGKTSLLMMLKLTHLLRFFPESVDFKLFRLDNKTLESIGKIKDQTRTVLLLDALDEDADASGRFEEYLLNLLQAVAPFRQVIITCRTQFFPEAGESQAREKGAFKIGGYNCRVIHLSPFSIEQTEAYLKKEYPDHWLDPFRKILGKKGQYQKRERAMKVLESMETLHMHPMLLSHIDDLVTKEFTNEDEYLVYDFLIGLWLEREELRERRERRQPIATHAELWEICTAIALHLQSTGKHTLNRASIDELFKGTHVARIIGKFGDDGRYLLNRTVNGEYRFSHFSLREFLVARALTTSEAQKIPDSFLRSSDQMESFLCSWVKANPRERIAQIPWRVFNDRDVKSAVVKLLIRPGLDLHNVDLRRLSLKGMKNIKEVDFSKADLREADLENSEFEQVKLSGADLREATFAGSLLQDVSLDHVNARDASFRGATLQGDHSDLAFGCFVRADFTGASIQGVTAGAGFLLSRGSGAAELSGAAGPPQPRALRFVPQHGHSAEVHALCWHRSGRLVATGSADGTIRLWDLVERRAVLILEDQLGIVRCLAWRSDGGLLASGSEDGTVRLWDTWKGVLLESVTTYASPVLALSWGADERLLTAVMRDGHVRTWRIEDHLSQVPGDAQLGPLSTAAWRLKSPRLVAAAGAGASNILLWPVDRASSPKAVGKAITTVEWNPVEDSFVTGSEDSALRLWEIAGNGRLSLQSELKPPADAPPRALSWSPKGKFLLSASVDGMVKLWDIDSRKSQDLGMYPGTTVMAWAPDERSAAMGGADGSINIWRGVGSQERLEPCTFVTTSVAWSPSQRWIASQFADGSVRIVDIKNPAPREAVVTGLARSISWAPDGIHLAVGCDNGFVTIFEAEAWLSVATLKIAEARINAVTWAPEGSRLAIGSADGSVTLWNWESDGREELFSRPDDPVNAVEWDLPQELLVTSVQSISFWDLENHRFSPPISRQTDRPDGLIWLSRSSRHNLLARGYVKGSVQIQNLKSGRHESTLEIPGKVIDSVVWSHSSEKLVSLCSDGTIQLWDLPNKRRFGSLPVSGRGVDWNADSTRLAVGCLDGSTTFWDVTGEVPRAILRIYHFKSLMGLIVTADGYLDGPQAALDCACLADGWALYNLLDIPERRDPERIRSSLREAVGFLPLPK